MNVHNYMPKNEYVQIDDENSIFEAMGRINSIAKDASDTSAQFNSLLGQKQELYNLAKVLARELIHDLHDLGKFVKPANELKKIVAPKRTVKKRVAPKRTVKKRVAPKRTEKTSSMQKLKANIKKAKTAKSGTKLFNDKTNKMIKKLEI